MSFWSKLFSRAKPGGGNTLAHLASVDAGWKHADCVFCGRQQIECAQSAPYLYPVWKCSCGAIGSGAWLADLDEVGDQLLDLLGMNTVVSEPCVPADHAAVSIQRYDVDKVERDMAEILKSHGYEFRIAPGNNPNERRFWAKRLN